MLIFLSGSDFPLDPFGFAVYDSRNILRCQYNLLLKIKTSSQTIESQNIAEGRDLASDAEIKKMVMRVMAVAEILASAIPTDTKLFSTSKETPNPSSKSGDGKTQLNELSRMRGRRKKNSPPKLGTT